MAEVSVLALGEEFRSSCICSDVRRYSLERKGSMEYIIFILVVRKQGKLFEYALIFRIHVLQGIGNH